MKKLIFAVGVVTVIGAVAYVGCSRDEREEAMARVSDAMDTLKGKDGTSTPAIVREQQRKERIRQNTQWTPENQALHPVEYCQAQLEELERCTRQLDVSVHKYAVGQSEAKQKIAESEAQLKVIDQFLRVAKDAYRRSESSNSWPVVINGYTLSKEKMQEKIVEVANKVEPLKAQIQSQKNIVEAMAKKSAKAEGEKRRITELRDRIQRVIGDLNAKKILDGEKGVTDALNAIGASMESLGTDGGDPSLEDIVTPSETAAREATFNEIMAK